MPLSGHSFCASRLSVYSANSLAAFGLFEPFTIDVVAGIAKVPSLGNTLAILCLEAGKPVIVEKPLAITLRAGKRMMEAAEQSGQLLAVLAFGLGETGFEFAQLFLDRRTRGPRAAQLFDPLPHIVDPKCVD